MKRALTRSCLTVAKGGYANAHAINPEKTSKCRSICKEVQMPTKIVNLTGHPLVLGNASKGVKYKSEGRLRLDTHYEESERVEIVNEQGKVITTIPLLRLLNGEHSSLPVTEAGTLFVVSGLVAGRVKRPDIVAPARIHREDGRAMYARALLRYTS